MIKCIKRLFCRHKTRFGDWENLGDRRAFYGFCAKCYKGIGGKIVEYGDFPCTKEVSEVKNDDTKV